MQCVSEGDAGHVVRQAVGCLPVKKAFIWNTNFSAVRFTMGTCRQHQGGSGRRGQQGARRDSFKT